MPTNRLWLEHTEQAAWDSVQALRDKITQAERRIERLGPPVADWQPLLDELDRARERLGLTDKPYVAVLRRLLELAGEDRERVQKLERELASRGQPSGERIEVAELLRRPAPASFDQDEDLWSQEWDGHTVACAVERRRRELASERALPGDIDGLMAAIEAKGADLEESEGKALADAALDLSVLALALAGLCEDDD